MQERTADGYVFRTDLRLRPDPGSTPPVIPIETALNYYEAHGQNWERAALIKARPVAGDIEAAVSFLNELAPFIWRKHLDFAAIQDVHSIKRQIHAHKGHAEIAVAGHNIKLGRGGIREIEFFAQTQQLIAGGRIVELRKLRTVEALASLCDLGWIDAKARDELTSAYWYLRDLEHRLQMVADEQTHTLPTEKGELLRIALMMGCDDTKQFSSELKDVLITVEHYYADLFESAPELSLTGGNLAFTGEDDDPGTVATLEKMGFSRPSDTIRTIKGWHYGRYAALQTSQARELLTELTPALLEKFSETGNADQAIFGFDRFVSGLPAGIQLFSLLKTNPALMSLLIQILGAAPRLADTITRKPHVFDGLLDPNMSGSLPQVEALGKHLDALLSRSPNYELALDAARIFALEQKFLIGIHLFTGSITAYQAGEAYSDLADILIDAMLKMVSKEFESQHGNVAGGKVCVLGMGRLGSRELTAGSDLDLIFLYDHENEADKSDGAKPLYASQYFIRLTQRLITAMSAPTAEGVLYELDFRLRPSGKAGPLATHVGSFLKYQSGEAWTWESQALTRARCVAGDPDFSILVKSEIEKIITLDRDPRKLRRDVRGMRKTIDDQKKTSNLWNIKDIKGGLIDIEFIGQWAELQRDPVNQTSARSTREQIENASKNLIAGSDKSNLLKALDFYTIILQLLRLCISDTFSGQDAPQGLREVLCKSLGLPSLSNAEAHLKEAQGMVRTIFSRVLRS